MSYIKSLCIILVLSNFYLYALPETTHPYYHNLDQWQTYTSPGSIALEVRFSSKTFTAPQDIIEIVDRNNEVLGEYSGKELANQTILVEGDTVKVHFITNSTQSGYGFKIQEIRSIYSPDYFIPHIYDYSKTGHIANENLKEELYDMVKSHTSLGYRTARQKMFGSIDNVNGQVRCVYTARWVKTNTIPDPTDMNTEHTWPKSLGAGSEPAKSDIHHLFPSDSYSNSKRSNYPFGIAVWNYWSKGGSILGSDDQNRTIFMPREDHRGDVARAIFYFSIRYRKNVSDFEERVLKQWHNEDPVDEKEILRNNAISQFQKNRNPFIDHPEYVSRIEDF